MSGNNLSGDDQQDCPLCLECLELDDINFYPCECCYQICRFCWNKIRTEGSGNCPACRSPYSENPADFKPLSAEEISRIKADKKQRDLAKKQKVFENRKHLANVRVVQRNLVFVVGLPPKLADSEILSKPDYFGKFGKIHKVVINHSTSYAGNQNQGPSASAYVTYYKYEHALRAIQCVNGLNLDGRVIKASLGTTKYCAHFMKNQPCPKHDCMYLHEPGDEAASFTKDEMQHGRHTEFERRLHEDMLRAAEDEPGMTESLTNPSPKPLMDSNNGLSSPISNHVTSWLDDSNKNRHHNYIEREQQDSKVFEGSPSPSPTSLLTSDVWTLRMTPETREDTSLHPTVSNFRSGPSETSNDSLLNRLDPGGGEGGVDDDLILRMNSLNTAGPDNNSVLASQPSLNQLKNYLNATLSNLPPTDSTGHNANNTSIYKPDPRYTKVPYYDEAGLDFDPFHESQMGFADLMKAESKQAAAAAAAKSTENDKPGSVFGGSAFSPPVSIQSSQSRTKLPPPGFNHMIQPPLLRNSAHNNYTFDNKGPDLDFPGFLNSIGANTSGLGSSFSMLGGRQQPLAASQRHGDFGFNMSNYHASNAQDGLSSTGLLNGIVSPLRKHFQPNKDWQDGLRAVLPNVNFNCFSEATHSRGSVGMDMDHVQMRRAGNNNLRACMNMSDLEAGNSQFALYEQRQRHDAASSNDGWGTSPMTTKDWGMLDPAIVTGQMATNTVPALDPLKHLFASNNAPSVSPSDWNKADLDQLAVDYGISNDVHSFSSNSHIGRPRGGSVSLPPPLPVNSYFGAWANSSYSGGPNLCQAFGVGSATPPPPGFQKHLTNGNINTSSAAANQGSNAIQSNTNCW